MPREYDAILFDLLSALVDSWSLWGDIAGDSALGREWRRRYLESASRTRCYEPYTDLVGESAKAVGLPESCGRILARRWGDLAPWPEAPAVVAGLASRAKVGVVTNCSEPLGRLAANSLGVDFDVLLTAERAGFYKPDPRTYQMAIDEIGIPPERILYVAGSPYDVRGAASAGMPVYWHNRAGFDDADAGPLAIDNARSLLGLVRR